MNDTTPFEGPEDAPRWGRALSDQGSAIGTNFRFPVLSASEAQAKLDRMRSTS